MIVNIATGRSRYAKEWKNRSWEWDELAKRLTTTTRTAETVAEFKTLSKDQQDKIKDVGGFIGGYCVNGDRRRTTSRQILTLDADFLPADTSIWEDFKLLYGCAAVAHSTHKHTPKAPRLRLIIPLSREVTPEEYEAIGRKVAESLGIDYFDDTTYQVGRLMYWPSTSLDGDFIGKVKKGPPLDVDEELKKYRDWHDVSEWPISSRLTRLIAKHKRSKQQNPLDKEGPVGYFCRTYTISQAIEAFLSDVYTLVSEGRYTYTGGSTSGGAVVYDDLYLYSHHGTDPASGQECNAFDLVRLHKFGELDKDTGYDTAINKLPSFKAMVDLAINDIAVKHTISKERLKVTAQDFSTLDEPKEEEDEWKWAPLLKLDKKGAYEQTVENICIVLEKHPAFKGRLAFNEFTQAKEIRGQLPWRKADTDTSWNDADDAYLRAEMEKIGLIGRNKIYDALEIVMHKNRFHPIREYFSELEWDGIPRVDRLLIDYLGAEDTEYTRAVTRKTIVAACKRVFEPGCKFDYMLVLKGAQGVGKSTLVKRLAKGWGSDSLADLRDVKGAREQVRGAWIIEMGELNATKKADSEAIKQFLSITVDRYRQAYGHNTQNYPRQCIFIGTTNEAEFLKDLTGNRRYWIVELGNTPTSDVFSLQEAEIDQIWAEAYTLYKEGEPVNISRELETQASLIQEGYVETDPWLDIITEYISRGTPEGWDTMDILARRRWLASDDFDEPTNPRTEISIREIWAEALCREDKTASKMDTNRIGALLRTLPGYKGACIKRIKIYGSTKVFKLR